MIKELKAIFRARKFEDYSHTHMDAVLASTSPAKWMDIERADAALSAVWNTYPTFDNVWYIAAGWLGGLPYEESQRKTIVDRWLEIGVPEERIIQIDGKDTVDKVRELIWLPQIKSGEIINLGV